MLRYLLSIASWFVRAIISLFTILASDSNQKLREEFLNYNPQSVGMRTNAYRPRKLSIRLFGRIGHGKSTFINNCLCVVKDTEYRNEAGEGDSQESFTVELKRYRLSDYVEIVDNIGAKSYSFSECYEFRAQLDGYRKVGKQVGSEDWGNYFRDCVTSRDADWQNTMYIPVIIYRGDFLSFQQEKPKIKPLTDSARKFTGMWPIIVITQATGIGNFNVNAIFQSLHCPDVFLLNNYHWKDDQNVPVERDEETDEMILKILLQCLKRVKEVIESITTEYKPAKFN
ncbi:uncharacterized protein LOC122541379 isoform X2 [Chiloscyllium plagiosum]|uniref:uncharacterized protein LOC122541379 isoform X2 n=1 Tax=Chiloscyllium plagiosum TaxID=36176 RepID=UPI001CB81E25|nr:uncharacterized protein LOC122541379 isoform X2 [Chiloscyllium plagiosum]